jgi:hypothetical protein
MAMIENFVVHPFEYQWPKALDVLVKDINARKQHVGLEEN